MDSALNLSNGDWFDMPIAVVERTYRTWLALKGITGGIR